MSITEFFDTVSFKGEEWKPIVGYDGYYVSSNGRIASKKKGRAHILTPCVQKSRGKDYCSVCLFNGKPNKIRVHRLVAAAFLDNCDGKSEIDHINNDGTDNRAVNLRWCSHKENMSNPITSSAIQKYRDASNIDCYVFYNKHEAERKRVFQYKGSDLVRTYNSLGEVEKYGYVKCSVSAACHGRLKTYRGYTWSF